MFSSRSRDTLPQAAVALAIIATAVVLLTRIAHAAQAAAPPPTVPFDWNFWTGVLSAVAIAGSYVLHALAARRHSATLEKWATAIDEGRVIVKGAAPAPLAVPKASGVGTAAMLFVVLIWTVGAGIAMNPACTAAERSAVATSAGHAVINCTAQDLGTTPGLDLATLVAIANTAAAERAKCMTAAGLDWKCVETDAIGQGVTLGGCALVQLVAAAAKAITPATSGLVASPTAPPGRAELEDFRGRVGGATWHTATRDY